MKIVLKTENKLEMDLYQENKYKGHICIYDDAELFSKIKEVIEQEGENDEATEK